jgi:glycosyltransferase involved in cell wall biosynthesis
MSEAVYLSVIVPAFNEADNLGRVIADVTAGLNRAGIVSYELLVVDDGSSDGTGKLADALASAHRHVKVIHHDRNRGFGAAVRSGYAVSSGEYVTQIPADGEVQIGEALGLLAAIGSNDLIASRRDRPASARRDAITAAFHRLMRLLLGFDGRGLDGIFVIRGSLIRGLTLESSTGLVNLETLMRCSRKGVTIAHGVMRASPRLSGRSKVTNLRTMARLFAEILALRRAISADESTKSGAPGIQSRHGDERPVRR